VTDPSLLEVTGLRTWFPIRRGVFRRVVGLARGRRGGLDSPRARRWRWSASAGAARPRGALAAQAGEPREGSGGSPARSWSPRPRDLRGVRPRDAMVFQDPDGARSTDAGPGHPGQGLDAYLAGRRRRATARARACSARPVAGRAPHPLPARVLGRAAERIGSRARCRSSPGDRAREAVRARPLHPGTRSGTARGPPGQLGIAYLSSPDLWWCATSAAVA
jgi:hypothetical protein